jgi:hypothetical protein
LEIPAYNKSIGDGTKSFFAEVFVNSHLENKFEATQKTALAGHFTDV